MKNIENSRNIYTERLTITSKRHETADKAIITEITENKEWEFYFGSKQTPDLTEMFTINKNLYYSIHLKDSDELIGYLGFYRPENDYEPEIYIFKRYRNHGYGTEALSSMVSALFKKQLQYIDSSEDIEKIAASVRTENIISQKMMRKIGFHRTGRYIVKFLGDLDNPEEFNPIPLIEFTAKKDDFIKHKEE